MQSGTGQRTRLPLEQSRSLQDQVVPPAGERGIGTGEGEVGRVRLKRQLIREIDALEDRLDLVIAVRPLAEDAQVEVELGGRTQADHVGRQPQVWDMGRGTCKPHAWPMAHVPEL
jgi:hypothetical protein